MPWFGLYVFASFFPFLICLLLLVGPMEINSQIDVYVDRTLEDLEYQGEQSAGAVILWMSFRSRVPGMKIAGLRITPSYLAQLSLTAIVPTSTFIIRYLYGEYS